MVEGRRELNGKITDETRFYINSLVMPAAAVGPMIRARWAIESLAMGHGHGLAMMNAPSEPTTPGRFRSRRHIAHRAKISSASGAKPLGRNDEYLANLIAAKIICMIDEQACDQASRRSDQP